MKINDATDIRIGTTQASKVYMGSVQIWPTTPIGTNFLKTTARGNNVVFTFSIPAGVSTSNLEYISYSVDNGSNWVTTNNVDNQAVTINTPSISNNASVLWRGVGKGTTNDNSDSSEYCTFSSSYDYDVSGNILSLIWGNTDFDNMANVAFSQAYTFFRLFYHDTHVVNADQLLFPSISLRGGSYREMFLGCTSLYKAPSIISATNLWGNCMRAMFSGCTSLQYAPILPATTMAQQCYEAMFVNCTSLRTPPALPATTLATECYKGMFGQAGIDTVPTLPATTLADRCYDSMFANCTRITSGPTLPATTIMTESYIYMFNGCSLMGSLKCLATSGISEANCYMWMVNVPSAGTFIRSGNTSWPRSASGVPSGWTLANSL